MTPNDFTMTKQILKLQKTFAQNNIKTLSLWLTQGERVTRTCLEQAGAMPAEAKRAWEHGSELFQSGRETIEAIVDIQFDMIAGMLNPSGTKS